MPCKPLRALVIEPDPIVAVALCALLEEEGYECDPSFPFAARIQEGADLVLMRQGVMPCAIVPARRRIDYRTETLSFTELSRIAADLRFELEETPGRLAEAA